MKKKSIATMTLLSLTALSCFLFTTCNFLVEEDEDDLPLEEWYVTKVEYHPNFRVPYVEVFFSYKTHGSGYHKEGATDEWLSKLMTIPGLELGEYGFIAGGMDWDVKSQTATDGDPLTAFFSHEVFIRLEGESWGLKEVARIRIKTDSMAVTIIE